MRIKKLVKRTREAEETHDIFCNKCGESCLLPDSGEPPYDDCCFGGLIEATVGGGYFSKDFADGDNYTFSMCEKCLLELFDTFVISPEKREFF